MVGWLAVEIASAATLRVGPTRPYTTIQAALGAAAAGDRVEVDAGTYTGPFTVDRAVTLVGVGGAQVTTLVASGRTPDILLANASLTLQGFTIDGQAGRRGILGAPGLPSLTVDQCVFRNNDPAYSYVSHGGALLIQDAVVRVTNSVFVGNDSRAAGGAAYFQDAQVTLQGNRFVNNSVFWGAGGAVYVWSPGLPVVVTDNTFARNTAIEPYAVYTFEGNGGAIAVLEPGSVEVARNTFARNTAQAEGAGLFLLSNSGPAVIEDNRFCENAGTAIKADDPLDDLTISGNSFGANSALWGGAVWVEDWYGAGFRTHVNLVDNSFASNTGDPGAVWLLHVSGTLANNVFALSPALAVRVDAGAGAANVLDYNLWWRNGTNLAGGAVGAHDVFADPGLVGWSDDGDCTNDSDLATGAGVDAGTPLRTDPDGTVSDIGSGP